MIDINVNLYTETFTDGTAYLCLSSGDEMRQKLVITSYSREGGTLAATYKDFLSFPKTTILYLAMSFQLKALMSKVLVVTE